MICWWTGYVNNPPVVAWCILSKKIESQWILSTTVENHYFSFQLPDLCLIEEDGSAFGEWLYNVTAIQSFPKGISVHWSMGNIQVFKKVLVTRSKLVECVTIPTNEQVRSPITVECQVIYGVLVQFQRKHRLALLSFPSPWVFNWNGYTYSYISVLIRAILTLLLYAMIMMIALRPRWLSWWPGNSCHTTDLMHEGS